VVRGSWYDSQCTIHDSRDTLHWGSDGGNRVFDILVEGTKCRKAYCVLATQRPGNNRPGRFYDEVYSIGQPLTKGKDKVTVKFQAHPGAWAGGIFGLKVLKKATPGTSAKSNLTLSRLCSLLMSNSRCRTSSCVTQHTTHDEI